MPKSNHFFTKCDLHPRPNAVNGATAKFPFRMELLVAFICFMPFHLKSTPNPPSKLGFTVSFDKQNIRIGDTIDVIFKAKSPLGYHVYSEKSDCPQDDGPIRSELTFSFNPAIELMGSFYGLGDHMVLDNEIWNCSTGEFEDVIEFHQKIVVIGDPGTILVQFYGQKCSQQDGVCYLVQEDISVDLPMIH